MLFFNLSGARESWEVTDRRGPGLPCHLQLLSLLLPQNNYLEATVTDTEQQGELALKDTQAKLWSSVKPQQVRDDWAQLLRDYQELLSTKLALGVGLTSSCRLLEGEECRWAGTLAARGTCLEEGAHQALSPGLDPQ